ncbi:MAG TPA: hypothetical protein VKA60_26260 [Blastocatellia bacterium]|nr:hypothetical protein [Blastocatellia bacterium]
MKKTLTILVTGLIVILLNGCTKPASDSNSAAKNNAAATNTASPTNIAAPENINSGATNANRLATAEESSPANKNGNANQSSAADSTGTPDPTKLVGTYVMNQIMKGGVATLITKFKVEYVFNANGRYSRVATVKGKTINTESGQFNVDGDRLTFKIVLSDKNIHEKPIEKNYTIRMTPDGREVRLTRNTGEVAVLKRTT